MIWMRFITVWRFMLLPTLEEEKWQKHLPWMYIDSWFLRKWSLIIGGHAYLGLIPRCLPVLLEALSKRKRHWPCFVYSVNILMLFPLQTGQIVSLLWWMSTIWYLKDWSRFVASMCTHNELHHLLGCCSIRYYFSNGICSNFPRGIQRMLRKGHPTPQASMLKDKCTFCCHRLRVLIF